MSAEMHINAVREDKKKQNKMIFFSFLVQH